MARYPASEDGRGSYTGSPAEAGLYSEDVARGEWFFFFSFHPYRYPDGGLPLNFPLEERGLELHL